MSGQWKYAGLAVLITAMAGSTHAHHSFAMWNQDRTLTLTGTIKSYEWTNPHVWIWFVSDDAAASTWGVEGGAVNSMKREGWARDTLVPGDKVTVMLHPERDEKPGEQHVGSLVSIRRADGTTVPAKAVAAP